MTFAAITASLVVGSLVERVKFSAMILFTPIWITLVYAPIAHMARAGDGRIFGMGAVDFAGGTVDHINAGIAGLVGGFVAGQRSGCPREGTPPHTRVLRLNGTGPPRA